MNHYIIYFCFLIRVRIQCMHMRNISFIQFILSLERNKTVKATKTKYRGHHVTHDTKNCIYMQSRTHTNTMSKCYYTISILKLAFYINKIGHNIIIIHALYVLAYASCIAFSICTNKINVECQKTHTRTNTHRDWNKQINKQATK